MITKVAPKTDMGEDAIDLMMDDEYGYVRRLQFEVGHRDPANFTFEVTKFGTGAHPNFEEPE